MFEVGKKVICIESHPCANINGVVKGKVFTINAITDNRCDCGLHIDIGISSKGGTNVQIGIPCICPTCYKVVIQSYEWWFRTK